MDVDLRAYPPPNPQSLAGKRDAMTTLTDPISLDEVQLAVKRIKPRSAPGPDKIPAENLKRFGKDFPKALVGLFNLWLYLRHIRLSGSR